MTLRLNGATSGYVEIDAPAVAGTTTITFPATNGTLLLENGGKVLQIVRSTDNIDRSTTSTSYVDTNLSVTITPQRSNSVILLWATANYFISANAVSAFGEFRITDSSNNAISGAQDVQIGHLRFTQSTAGAASGTTGQLYLTAYATPATTSPVTYKLRWKSASASTVQLQNLSNTVAQMYAIEVSA